MWVLRAVISAWWMYTIIIWKAVLMSLYTSVGISANRSRLNSHTCTLAGGSCYANDKVSAVGNSTEWVNGLTILQGKPLTLSLIGLTMSSLYALYRYSQNTENRRERTRQQTKMMAMMKTKEEPEPWRKKTTQLRTLAGTPMMKMRGLR